MDSLFWKIGPFRALAPGGAQPNEGSDSTKARSVQVSAHQSSTSQAKPIVTINTQLTEETASSTVPPLFSPLPVPSPRSAVPAPLKFLWFNKKSQGKASDKKDSETLMPAVEDHKEVFAFLDDQTIVRESQDEGACDDSEVASSAAISMEPKSPAVNGDDKLPTATDSLHAVVPPESTAQSNAKSWISRLVDFKALWPDPKTAQKQRNGFPLPPEPQTVTLKNSQEPVNTASEVGGSFPSCGLDGVCLEVPYTRVLHNKESFSKFLQDASLGDMKVVSQMSFLCDLAYMIPDIQPGQLLKYHHLRYVTSSLDRKAEAAAKEKESEARKCSLSENTASTNPAGGSSSSGIDPQPEPRVYASEPLTIPLKHPKAACEENTKGSADVRKAGETNGGLNTDHVKSQNDWQAPEQENHGPTENAESLMAVAPVTAVVVAEEETKQAVANDLQSPRSCPCEWYICDDQGSHTRFFVIQGSESLASWQANLSFEPTKFEGLDVLVHRGIYEAANALYDQVLPEVLAHFKAHGDLAQIRLTGHSLGGSLATLLALMFQIRKVIPQSAILPVVTFGSPCVMCGGDHFLKTLNLPMNHIQSVIMHKDIVPRAFACDYPDHVAQVLKRLNGRFRDHPCLNHQKLLYAPMGQLLILQPDENSAPQHPLLPSGRGLYILRHPLNGDNIDNAIELRAAQRAFLNMPHPLEILSDPGAYGFEGAISRDHDPRSYRKTLHLVLRHEARRLRRVQRVQRRQLWWPLVIAESSLVIRKGLKGSLQADQIKSSGSVTSAVSRPSLVFRQSVSYASTNQIGFASRSFSLWCSHKDSFSRYARLIASQHVQMGMLFILSVRVVILECLSTLFVWI